jgi:hypothetical protein
MRICDLLRSTLRGRILRNSGTTGYEPKRVHAKLTHFQYQVRYVVVLYMLMMLVSWDIDGSLDSPERSSFKVHCVTESSFFMRSKHSCVPTNLVTYPRVNQRLGFPTKSHGILSGHYCHRKNYDYYCPVLRRLNGVLYSCPTGFVSTPTRQNLGPSETRLTFLGPMNTSVNEIQRYSSVFSLGSTEPVQDLCISTTDPKLSLLNSVVLLDSVNCTLIIPSSSQSETKVCYPSVGFIYLLTSL